MARRRAREAIASLIPGDGPGVAWISPVAITPDGDANVYGYQRHLPELLVVEGME